MVDDTFGSGSTSRQQRTFAHELGHLLGLAHNLCDGADSVMRTAAYACGSTATVPNDPTRAMSGR